MAEISRLILSNAWSFIGGAALLGLIFGWAVKGLAAAKRVRRADVDRDVAKIELEQARSEIEGLYAAQRKLQTKPAATLAEQQAAAKASSAPPEDVEAAKAALAEKTAEADALRKALDDARAQLSAARATTPIETPAPAAAIDPDGAIQLEWRNRYLESRVRALESKLHDLSRADAAGEGDGAVEVAKLKWQRDYLRQRLAYIEDHGLATTAGPAKPDGAEQELARLRWRNRYLEGRLSYLENSASPGRNGGEPAPEVEDDETPPTETPDAEEGDEADDPPPRDAPSPPVEFATNGAHADAEEPLAAQADATGGEESADAPATESDPGPAPSGGSGAALGVETSSIVSPPPVALGGDVEDGEAEPEAIARPSDEVSPEAPDALDKPRGGAPDDLTRIQGVGPKIQELLNSFGVYHYDQIAEWTEANTAWIDAELGLTGRIEREGWVDQAKALAADGAA